MRFAHAVVIGAFLLHLSIARPCHAIDWKAFDDQTAIVMTEALAKSIAELPAPEKAEAIQRLRESLKSADVEIRRRAALTLNSLGDKSGVPTMIEAFTKAAGRDRDNIAVALRVLKDKRVIAPLRGALKDESPYVRGIAVAALGELKAAQAYEEIVALTKDKHDPRGKENGTLNCIPMLPAHLACYALGALGDQRAIPVLIELLDDKDLQGSAAQALEVLAKQKIGNEPEKWKAWWNAKGQ